jgi:hypothetical protein
VTVAYLDDGKMVKGEEASEEREGVVLVPHIGDNWPMTRQSGWTTTRIGPPILDC